jgi:hypothetical protein
VTGFEAVEPEAKSEGLSCARCAARLSPGSGEFWEVRIDAVADPWPPEFTEEDLRRDVRQRWAETIQQLRELTPQEAMAQIHRQQTIHLCNRCFASWYREPAS